MMWPQVVQATVALLKADATITTLLGGVHIYRNRTRSDIQIPSIDWSVVSSLVEENLAPVAMQWDVWCNDASTASQIEKQLYVLMHSDVPIQYTGLLMWSQYQTRYDLHDDNQGVFHSAVEYKYTPARLNG